MEPNNRIQRELVRARRRRRQLVMNRPRDHQAPVFVLPGAPAPALFGRGYNFGPPPINDSSDNDDDEYSPGDDSSETTSEGMPDLASNADDDGPMSGSDANGPPLEDANDSSSSSASSNHDEPLAMLNLGNGVPRAIVDFLGNESSSFEGNDSDEPPPAIVDRGDEDSLAGMPDLVQRRRRRGSLSSSDSDDDSSAGSMPPLVHRSSSSTSDNDFSDLPDLEDAEELSGDDAWVPPKRKLGITTFPQLLELSDDIITNILSFVTDIPFETEAQRASTRSRLTHLKYESTLTDVLPMVSRHFSRLCAGAVNYYWKLGLERLVKNEPKLWKKGLLTLLPGGQEEAQDDETEKELVERTFTTVEPDTYRDLFLQVVQRYMRLTLPVFYMPGFVQLGRQFGVHLFETRYQIMIANLLESYPEAARQGDHIEPNENGEVPAFIYAHVAPLRPGIPACLVEVQHCIIAEDGTADVSLMPVAHVRLERVRELPDTGNLNEATCVRMGEEESSRIIQNATAGFPHMEIMDLLAGHEGHRGAMGLGGTIHALLAYLAGDRAAPPRGRDHEMLHGHLLDLDHDQPDTLVDQNDSDDDHESDVSADSMPELGERRGRRDYGGSDSEDSDATEDMPPLIGPEEIADDDDDEYIRVD